MDFIRAENYPRKFLNIRLFIISALLCWLTAAPAGAQMIPEEAGTDSVVQALLPVISYGSTEGLFGGAMYNRYDYSGDIEPFHNYAEASAFVSTKGFVEVEMLYERTRTFGRDVRSRIDLSFRRYTADNFFGVGNSTTFESDLWEDEFYFVETIGAGFEYQARKPLYKVNEMRRFDLTGGFGAEYNIPYARGDRSAFAEQPPNGSSGGWSMLVSTGFVWENRDSEFDPSRGNRAEFQVRYFPAPVNEFPVTTLRLQFRQYFRLFNRLKIANRLEARHAGGDVPYWELSKLGDDYTLRGYPFNRFQGRSSLAYSLELRSWILEFPDFHRLKVGLHIFTDTGRVLTGEDDFSDLFRDYKQTVGVGGAVSIFSPDLIMRGSVGFSEDMSQIYIGIGYMF